MWQTNNGNNWPYSFQEAKHVKFKRHDDERKQFQWYDLSESSDIKRKVPVIEKNDKNMTIQKISLINVG